MRPPRHRHASAGSRSGCNPAQPASIRPMVTLLPNPRTTRRTRSPTVRFDLRKYHRVTQQQGRPARRRKTPSRPAIRPAGTGASRRSANRKRPARFTGLAASCGVSRQCSIKRPCRKRPAPFTRKTWNYILETNTSDANPIPSRAHSAPMRATSWGRRQVFAGELSADWRTLDTAGLES